MAIPIAPQEYQGSQLITAMTQPIQAATKRRKRQFIEQAGGKALTPFEQKAAAEMEAGIGREGAEQEAQVAQQVGLAGAEKAREERLISEGREFQRAETEAGRQFATSERMSTQDFQKIMQATQLGAAAGEAEKDRVFKMQIAKMEDSLKRDLSAQELNEMKRQFDSKFQLEQDKFQLEQDKFQEERHQAGEAASPLSWLGGVVSGASGGFASGLGRKIGGG